MYNAFDRDIDEQDAQVVDEIFDGAFGEAEEDENGNTLNVAMVMYEKDLEDVDDDDDDPRLYLGFVRLYGEEFDGLRTYELIFTKDKENFWGENFEYKPCCLCNGIIPEDKYITEVHKIKTKIPLCLVQTSCCFGMQDAIDGCVALAYEDITGLEEYPKDGRLVLTYGLTFEEVDDRLHEKGILIMD